MEVKYYLVCSVCGSELEYLGRMTCGGAIGGWRFTCRWGSFYELVSFLHDAEVRYGKENIYVKADDGRKLEVSNFLEIIKRADDWVMKVEEDER